MLFMAPALDVCFDTRSSRLRWVDVLKSTKSDLVVISDVINIRLITSRDEKRSTMARAMYDANGNMTSYDFESESLV